MSPAEQSRRDVAAFALAGSYAALVKNINASEITIELANRSINDLYRAHGMDVPKQLAKQEPA